MMKLNQIKQAYKGRFLSTYIANYTSPSGKNKNYEIISRRPLNSTEDLEAKKSDAVTVVCYNEDMTKMLIQKEFRMSVNDYVYDLPSGLIDTGETPEEAAARELKEETGLDYIKTVAVLPPCYTSVGMSNETIVPIYCIADGEITGSDNELEETIPMWITKDQAKDLLSDAKKSFDEGKQFTGFTNRTSAELYKFAFSKTVNM